MANFTLGTPITTTDPQIEVTVDPANPLSIGVHRFQLVVVDESGNSSAPTVVEVIVKDMTAPTAVLDAPPQVAFGQPFNLSGARSTDNGPDKIVQYVWSLADVGAGGGAPVVTVPTGIQIPAGELTHVIEQPGGLPTPVVTPPGQ
jgi:hypothetical protein